MNAEDEDGNLRMYRSLGPAAAVTEALHEGKVQSLEGSAEREAAASEGLAWEETINVWIEENSEELKNGKAARSSRLAVGTANKSDGWSWVTAFKWY